MDIKKAGCYKLYKCRSLLACDSGGTVYDTSQRLEDSDSETFYKNADESQSESGQSENIIYIIDNCDGVKTSNSPMSQQSLTDPNTHLNDDDFNDYEPYPNATNDSQCDIVQYVKEENVNQDDNCKYYIVQCDDIDSTQNSATDTLDSDSFDRENFEHYCDSINVSSSVEDTSINSSNNDTVSPSILIYNQEEAQLHNLSNFSQETVKSFDPHDGIDFENYSPFNPEIEPTVEHSRKRKQTYKVKNDSFTELLDEDSSDASSVSNISKKSKSVNNKDNQRRKLQIQKHDPFENLKLNSILRKDRSGANQIQSKDSRRKSSTSSTDENSEPSNVSSNDKEVFNCSEGSDQSRYSYFFPSHDNIFKPIDTFIRLNSDLTEANYLEYVQPREKIVESNMDKLLSPTIELEVSTITTDCKSSQFEPQTQGHIDFNGNEVNSKGSKNHNSNSEVSAREVVEKQLVSKAAFAKKLGYKNFFNTSNDWIVEDILFDRPCTFKEIKLEIDWVDVEKISQAKLLPVLLKNIDEYKTQHQQYNDPFKKVSCSLKDSLHDIDSFGGFAEDSSNEEEKVSQTGGIDDMVQNNKDTKVYPSANTPQELDEFSQFETYGNFNSSVEASSTFSSTISDVNVSYDSSKYIPSSSLPKKLPIAPLKLKIKRSGNDNQYIIDDSSIINYQVNDSRKSKCQKNPDSKYECSHCLEKFRIKKLLKSHISENHKGPYDSECEICHMKFKKSSAHKKHKPWCERSTVWKCEICDKVYCYKAVLLRHMKVH